MPKTPARLPALDSVRVIGAAAVAAQHAGFYTGVTLTATWGGWLGVLDVGVALFFVLSGFLLFRPWAFAAATENHRPGAGRYLWRRALRILPAYWILVVVCLAVLPHTAPVTTEDWVRHLTLTQIYDDQPLRVGLGHIWSLSTEVAFYLLLPLIAVLAVGRRWRPGRVVAVTSASLLVTGGWLAAMASGLLIGWPHGMWLPMYATWFSAGIALAAAHVALRTSPVPGPWQVLDKLGSAPFACWGVAVGLLAIATTPVAGHHDLTPPTVGQSAVRLLLYLGVAVMILLPVAFGPLTRTKAVLSRGVARWLGAVSYGLFLWHPLVLHSIYLVTDRPMFTGDLLTTYALTIGGGLLLATISYYLVERPVLRWGTRRRREGAATESHSRVAVASAAS